MISLLDAFSPTYAEARVKFLEAAAGAGLAVNSHVHPEPGPGGETLAVDVALDGPHDAERLLIVTSACHGVEGHCGSGLQVLALHDTAAREHAHQAGVAVLYVHALNPYGFAHSRRVTHENVDLNRNFHDFTQPLPTNQAYHDVHALLLPETWPPSLANTGAIALYIATHGLKAAQSAVSQGQHEFADGLFYGGRAPTWSNLCWRKVLQDYAARSRRLAWIDLHSGLGPSGVGERIFAGRDDAAHPGALQRARAWWGSEVTSIHDGSSVSAFLTGLASNAVYDECPQAEYTGIALEFGTESMLHMLQALRAEHWLHLHPEAPTAQAEEIRRQLRAAFYTDTDAWKNQIAPQARQAMRQAVDGLAGHA